MGRSRGPSLSKPWQILAALTLARLSMGFQFQTIPALASEISASGNLGFAAIGTLTGAYLLPGVVAALAGGWLGQHVGDSRTALWGLFLMTIGGIGGWVAETYGSALLWRFVAGTGAVGLNVMLTKMAADWFQNRADLPTAMGILVSSWPAGIAVSMLLLPLIAAIAGLETALMVPPAVCAVAFVMLIGVWEQPARTIGTVHDGNRPGLTFRELGLVLAAGLIWGSYNAALIAAIAWTPGLLREFGVDALSASAATSIIGWVAILSVAAGGWLASRSRRKDMPALASFAVSAVLLLAMPFVGASTGSPVFMAALGLAIGPAAAMIMTLPVEATRPENRSVAMGLYFAIYYGVMGLAPTGLGILRDATASSATPIFVAGGTLLSCIILWLGFRVVQRPRSALQRPPQ